MTWELLTIHLDDELNQPNIVVNEQNYGMSKYFESKLISFAMPL